MDRNAKEDKKLSVQDIVDKIYNELRGDLHIIPTDDNADKLVIRIRSIISNEGQTSDFQDL